MNSIRSFIQSTLKIKLFIHKKSILVKILMSYIIIGSMLITLFSSLLLMRYSDNSIKEMYTVSVNNLEKSVRAFDTLWNATFMYMNKEFKTNATLTEAMNSVDLTALEYGNIHKSLNEVLSNNNIFYSIYAYNSNADLVFSTIGPVTKSQNFYDIGIIDYIKNSKEKASNFTSSLIVYRKMQFKYGMSSQNKNIISVIFTDDDLKSALIFNIDQTVLQKLLEPRKKDDLNKIIIVNNEGTVISDLRPENIFNSITNQSYFKNMISENREVGYFLDNVNGKKSLVTYNRWEKWSNLNWIFVSIIDYNSLLGNLKQLQSNILKITVVFILLSLLIAGIFAGNIYVPFYKLLGGIKIKSADNDKLTPLSEYEYLKTAYELMESDIDNLKLYKTSSRIIIKKEILEQILLGELISNSELQKQIAGLSLNLEGEKFIVVVLRLDNFAEILEKYSAKDLALYRFAVCNITDEIMSENFKVETADIGEDTVSIIISVEGLADCYISQITADIKKIQEACSKYFLISLTAGIGTSEEFIKGIHFSYEKALEATNYRLIYGKKSILEYSRIIKERNENYEYPLDIEKSIIDVLKLADDGRIKVYLNMFIEIIRKYAYDEILLAVNQLCIISLRTLKNLFEADEMEQLSIITEYKVIKNTFSSFDTLDEIHNWLFNFYSIAVIALKKKKDNRYENIVGKIQQYIAENYMNSNISIELLSELVNLSPNYVRTLFKEITGKSLSNYINDLRFSKAKEFLINTDYPANKIAEIVGFPVSSYFYTSFRKAVGISPDEYRKVNTEL